MVFSQNIANHGRNSLSSCCDNSSRKKPFSLSLLSLFIYVFILPNSENSTSYNSASSYIYILLFYIGLIIMWALSFGLDERIFGVLVINALIDLIFLGAFL